MQIEPLAEANVWQRSSNKQKRQRSEMAGRNALHNQVVRNFLSHDFDLQCQRAWVRNQACFRHRTRSSRKFLANAEYQKVRVWDHQVLEIPQLSNTVQTHVAVRTETVAMSARLAVRRYGKVER